MAKAIVTGSEGFIGKALCKKLETENGVEVVRIDRSLGIEAKDIGDYLSDDVVGVFHLAAQTSVFNKDLNRIADDNIVAFIEVVEQCNKHGVPLVYASSSTANDGNTTSLYGLSKRFDEQFAKLYAKKATGVRLHNVYGSEPRPGTLLHVLMNNSEVTLYNNGENIRCFTHIDDATEGLIAALDCHRSVVNVVNYEPIRVADFAEEVAKYNGVRLIYEPHQRERDNVIQDVDHHLATVPLKYRNYHIGLKSIFEYGNKEIEI